MTHSRPTPELIERHRFPAAALVREHPLRWRHELKELLYRIACPQGCIHEGTLDYSRWSAMSLAGLYVPLDERPVETLVEGPFDYPPAMPGETPWHLNFAHSNLFCAYGGAPFAQDEIQVAEHPVLASLREGLLARGLQPRTVEQGTPTPVLIGDVQRRCAISTGIDPDAGRPLGLYGRRFARAGPDVVAKATRVLDPPTRSNILAMEAPYGSSGRYTEAQIESILATAITGFGAAREASSGRAVVHTGFWGCGAYGGNRTLMVMVQLVAARVAGLHRLAFHTLDQAGGRCFERARTSLSSLVESLSPTGAPVPLGEVIQVMSLMELEWGASDGN